MRRPARAHSKPTRPRPTCAALKARGPPGPGGMLHSSLRSSVCPVPCGTLTPWTPPRPSGQAAWADSTDACTTWRRSHKPQSSEAAVSLRFPNLRRALGTHEPGAGSAHPATEGTAAGPSSEEDRRTWGLSFTGSASHRHRWRRARAHTQRRPLRAGRATRPRSQQSRVGSRALHSGRLAAASPCLRPGL